MVVQLIITIDGTPTGGSPYPVFFSPPEAPEGADGGAVPQMDPTAAALGDASGAAPANSLTATAQEVARMLQPDLARISAASDAAVAAMIAQQNSMVRRPLQAFTSALFPHCTGSHCRNTAGWQHCSPKIVPSNHQPIARSLRHPVLSW